MKKKLKHVSKVDYSVNTSVNDRFWKIVLNFKRPDKGIHIPFLVLCFKGNICSLTQMLMTRTKWW